MRCAIYTRKSSEEGLEQDFNSLHAQREAGEARVFEEIGSVDGAQHVRPVTIALEAAHFGLLSETADKAEGMQAFLEKRQPDFAEFRVESLDEIHAHLHEAVLASPTGEAILEQYIEGTEMNGIVIARQNDAIPLTLDPVSNSGW